ncbi:zinc ribbon domain-containing protein [Kineococcus glutinatus]|uniref:C4-type zinc ribbon domain-containing protein n=1 Tax=Kineococcus glutinatus TaxID=1070872 RepID=A0ABP9I2A3_9ACTN
MPKAPAIDQQKLLDLQAVDTRLAQLAHRRATLPEQAELDALLRRHSVVSDEAVAARTAVSDVEREVTRAEADVTVVRQRADRDRARLDAGTGSPKELEGLQHELESLARRQGVLEDVELEVMERLEQAQGRASRAEAELAEVAAAVREAERRRDEALAGIATEETAAVARRQAVAMGIDDALVATYEKLRSTRGGVGAAMLRARRCEGCRLELNTVDINRLRAAAADDVVRCEECGRILVRTAESGL